MEAEDLSEMMNSIDMDEGGVAETIETEVAEAEVDMASGFVPDFFEVLVRKNFGPNTAPLRCTAQKAEGRG